MIRHTMVLALSVAVMAGQPAISTAQTREEVPSLAWYGADDRDRLDDFIEAAEASYYLDGDGSYSPANNAGALLRVMVDLVDGSEAPAALFASEAFATLLSVPAARYVWVDADYDYRQLLLRAQAQCGGTARCSEIGARIDAAIEEKEREGEPEPTGTTIGGDPIRLAGYGSGARLIDRLDDAIAYGRLRGALQADESARARRILQWMHKPFAGAKSNEFRMIMALADRDREALSTLVPIMADGEGPCSPLSMLMQNAELVLASAEPPAGCDMSVERRQRDLDRIWTLIALADPQDSAMRNAAGIAATHDMVRFDRAVQEAIGQQGMRPVSKYFDEEDLPIWRARLGKAFYASSDDVDRGVANSLFRNLQMTGFDAAAIGAALAAAEREAFAHGEAVGKAVQEYQYLFNPNVNVVEAKPGVYFPRDVLRGPEGEKRKRDLITTINAAMPDYFAKALPQALSLSQTQALLAPDEVLVLAFPSQSGTITFAVTSTHYSWSVGGWSSDSLARSVIRLRWELGDTQGIPQIVQDRWLVQADPGFSFDRNLAHALHEEVLGGIAPLLEGKRRMIVVAKDDLSALPFDILVTQPPKGDDGDPDSLRATEWLADMHAISIAPSIHALALARNAGTDRDTPETAFMGFGDPSLSQVEKPRIETTDRGRTRNTVAHAMGQPSVRDITEMVELPGTREELLAMQDFFGVNDDKVFLGKEATEAQVRANVTRPVRVLSFATHAIRPYELEGLAQAAIVLTPPDAAQRPPENDGLLLGAEIAGLRIEADWVILSACNTRASGFGERAPASFAGLPEAFIYAGSRSLLISHWPVSDEVAPKLTLRTLQIARETGLSRAEALNKAAREIRNTPDRPDWAHPSLWAPFSLVGAL